MQRKRVNARKIPGKLIQIKMKNKTAFDDTPYTFDYIFINGMIVKKNRKE